nr:MAG TPA: hypothetical protein [Caudoviricetes sp.]
MACVRHTLRAERTFFIVDLSLFASLATTPLRHGHPARRIVVQLILTILLINETKRSLKWGFQVCRWFDVLF